MALKVAVTSGIYYAARDIELHNAIRKLGYTLTRGVNAVEIAADVAHEVPYSHGKLIRAMAKKQGVDITFHGDLAVPFEQPDRTEWRDCHDRVTKSIRSAVNAGSKYIDFHASLNIWLELVTYAGRKLTVTFCDHEGNFISRILKENERLRKWFIEKKGDDYERDIFSTKDIAEIRSEINSKLERWEKEELDRRTREELNRNIGLVNAYVNVINVIRASRKEPLITASEVINDIIDSVTLRSLPPAELPKELRNKVVNVINALRDGRVSKSAQFEEEITRKKMSKNLTEGKPWRSEELRGALGTLDGYHIMSHYMFYTKDLQWTSMWAQYPELHGKYKIDYSDPAWLDWAWDKAESENDRTFKEFFYAAVAAKFLEGHMKAALNWINNEFISKELAKIKEEKDREELINIAKNLIIGIENPDAREPQHGGLYFIFRPKQLYSAVKTIRQALKTDLKPERIMMIIDHEHVATQGLDALQESNETIKTKPDFGELVISVHSNHPNPLQPHAPLELGDEILYQLLYNLRITGLGKKRTAYLLFERGGGEDPFKQSVETLRLMATYLEKDTPPDKLPLEFYGVKGEVAGNFRRQSQIIRDHRNEPLKDLLEMPEEEWSMLSQEAIRKGRKPETWKKGELR